MAKRPEDDFRSSRRPLPPPPPRRPSRPDAFLDDDEKTSAINIDNIDLGASAGSMRDFIDDDDEATSAVNIDDLNLPDLAPRASSAGRPVPPRSEGARPAAGRVPPGRPVPGRPAPPPMAHGADVDDDDDDDIKTSAIDLDVLNREQIMADARAKLAQGSAASLPPRGVPQGASPYQDDDDDDEGMATAAIDMSEINQAQVMAQARAKLAQSGASRGAAPGAPGRPLDPGEAERTMAVSIEDFSPPAAGSRRHLGASGASGASARAGAVGGAASASGRSSVLRRAQELHATKVEEKPEPVPQILITKGPDTGTRYSIREDSVLFGRGVDANCVINDPSASRKHFRIERAAAGWKLVDLGSGNGTRVNGQKVKETALRPGMKIEAGSTVMEWQFEGAEDAPSAVGDAASSAAGAASGFANRDFGDEDDVEKTTFGDVAAMGLDPELERIRLMQLEKQEEDFPLADLAESSGGGGKRGLVLGLLALLVLGGGFVAADKFMGLGIVFSGSAPSATLEKTAASEQEDEVDESLLEAEGIAKKAEQALSQKRPFLAARLYQEALAVNDDIEGGYEGLARAESEGKALQALAVILEAFDEGDGALKGRMAELSLLPALGELGKAAEPTLRTRMVGVFLGEYGAALAEGDYKKAQQSLKALKGLPGLQLDAMVIWEDAVERGLSEDGDMQAENPSEKASASDLKPGFESYASGDTSGAFNAFAGIEFEDGVSKADVGKARVFSAAAMLVGEQLTFLNEQLALEDGPKDDLSGTMKSLLWADAMMSHGQKEAVYKTYEGFLNFELKKLEGEKGALEQAILARRALQINPENQGAQAILAALAEKVPGLEAQAEALMKSSPDEAADLIGKILIYSPSGAPGAKNAKTLLKTLLASSHAE